MAKIRCLDCRRGERYTAIHGDCVEVMRQMPADSIDFAVFSPPFSSLYIYGESVADMGNSADDAEFLEHYRFFADQLTRVIRPGRIVAVHCKDLVAYSSATADGSRGARDLPGDLLRVHQDAGLTYHRRVTIWRSPVREMAKTKNDALLFKNFRTDAARCSVGLPEYLILLRKWADGMAETAPVQHPPERWNEWAGEGEQFVGAGSTEDYYRALDVWQEWASPVWMTTRETDVLNAERDPADEKHICPMPLDLTERAVSLWSNPGDVVLSPFMGIGSEGVVALRRGRRFVGIDLHDRYFPQACRHLDETERVTAYGDLFSATGAA